MQGVRLSQKNWVLSEDSWVTITDPVPAAILYASSQSRSQQGLQEFISGVLQGRSAFQNNLACKENVPNGLGECWGPRPEINSCTPCWPVPRFPESLVYHGTSLLAVRMSGRNWRCLKYRSAWRAWCIIIVSGHRVQSLHRDVEISDD